MSYVELRQTRGVRGHSGGWAAPPPPPSHAPGTSGVSSRVVEVTFRKRKLGLDLRYNAARCAAVLAEDAGTLYRGDALHAMDGRPLVVDSEEAFQALFFRLADGPRPTTLSFLREESTAVAVPTARHEGVYEITAAGAEARAGDGRDAVVAFGRGSAVVLRGALSRERRRSVVAVRSCERCGDDAAAGDTFLGVDGTLVVPRADARDVTGAATARATKGCFNVTFQL